jgi:hypothetical protein
MNALPTNQRILFAASVITTLALAVAAVGIVSAAVPTTGGNLRACVNNSTGLLRLLDTGQTCTSKETAIRIASADATGRVADAQRLDGKDSAAFVQNGAAAGGALSGSYPNPLLGANTIFGGHINDQTFTDGDIAPVGDRPKSFQIPNGAIQGAEIADSTITGADIAANTVTGPDVNEATLATLDGHDAFKAECDPHDDNIFILCASLTFTTGRQMPVFITVVYSVFHEISDQDSYVGTCKTRLDGVDQVWVGNGDNSFEYAGGYYSPDAGVPIHDVITVSQGTHTLDFLCRQVVNDIVFGDIRLAVIELGMD